MKRFEETREYLRTVLPKAEWRYKPCWFHWIFRQSQTTCPHCRLVKVGV